jgi:molybdopterin synthase sulfur carrier subunit
MNLTLKYFGLVVDITQKKEEILAMGESETTVSVLKSKIENRYEELKNTNYSIAVNQSMVSLEYSIQDQDVVALLPPFAGG